MVNSFQKLKKKLSLILRHGFVSIFCGCIEYGLFLWMFLSLHVKLQLAYFLSFAISVFTNFILHAKFTFKLEKIKLRNLIFYSFQIALVLILGFYLFKHFLNVGIKPELAKILQLIITFLFNVAFGKFISFK